MSVPPPGAGVQIRLRSGMEGNCFLPFSPGYPRRTGRGTAPSSAWYHPGKTVLTLSFASSRYRFGKMRYNEPNRFLEEVPGRHVRKHRLMRSRKPVAWAHGQRRTCQQRPRERHFKRQTVNSAIRGSTGLQTSGSQWGQTGMKVLHLKFGEGKVL